MLYELIIDAKNKKADAPEAVIVHFLPQIKKYSRLLEGNDTYQSLILFLLELLNKIPLEKECLQNDKIMFSYISKSLKHKYISMSIRSGKLSAAEVGLDVNTVLADHYNFESSILLKDALKVLNRREYELINQLFFYGYTVKEISAALHVSKQAVNQLKNRALKKLLRHLKN